MGYVPRSGHADRALLARPPVDRDLGAADRHVEVDVERVQVLARRDVAQRERPAMRTLVSGLRRCRNVLLRPRASSCVEIVAVLTDLSSSSVSRSMPRSSPVRELRSHRWYGVNDLRSFGHRSRTLQMGFDREDYAGKPVIAVVNTWSEINPCHTH